MTEDEWNRNVEFLVAWQARFAARLEAMEERQARYAERMAADMELARERQAAFDLKLERLEDMAGTALDVATRAGDVLTRFIEEQAKSREEIRLRFAETDRQIVRVARLIEAHAREGHGPRGE